MVSKLLRLVTIVFIWATQGLLSLDNAFLALWTEASRHLQVAGSHGSQCWSSAHKLVIEDLRLCQIVPGDTNVMYTLYNVAMQSNANQ